MSNLKKLYFEKIVPKMQKEIGFKNKFEVPKVVKVIVNAGFGKFRDNQKYIDQISNNLSAITGQKPILRKAKKAISGFKVRQGDSVGFMVTLRNEKMYDFLEKLVNVTLPRLRDFSGINPQAFDGRGNITIGIKEHLVFPEVANVAEHIHGLEVTIVTTAKNKEHGQKLLQEMGFPFNKDVHETRKNNENKGNEIIQK